MVSAAEAARFGINSSAISYLTTAAPREKIILGAKWASNPWDVNLRGTYYGRSSTVDQNQATFGFVNNQIDPAFIVDLEGGYTLGAWHFAVGANNLFNTFPNNVDPATPTSDIFNVNSPYGYQGGYYYTRVSVDF